jgi:hypothetical protein
MIHREPTNVGIGASAHPLLRDLKESGPFSEMLHAYRFAVALALVNGAQMVSFSERQNLFNVGSVDDEQRSLYHAVRELRGDVDEPVYHTVEKLATWGVQELHRNLRAGDISFLAMLGDVT